MFPVGRYDPDKDNDAQTGSESKSKRKNKDRDSTLKKKKKKKDRQDDNHNRESNRSSKTTTKSTTSLMHVIAPEEKPSRNSATKLLATKTDEEAFDDLDVTAEDIIEGDNNATNSTAVTNDMALETEDTVEAAAGTASAAAAMETDEGKDDVKKKKNESSTGGQQGGVSQEEVRTALHMSSIPIVEAAERWKIAPFLLNNLKRDGFESFFPIQALSIPDVIASERYAHIRARDVCISAPTGSGKTLAYVLPVLNSLYRLNKGGMRNLLRALVVLPSRDLATQVHSVFESYVEGSEMRVGLAIGQSSFKSEQIALTVDPTTDDDGSYNDALRHQRLLSFEPGNLDHALKAFRLRDPTRTISSSRHRQHQHHFSPDVLVCTPGRLVDHLDNTPGFTLQHLRFLVVDEADRLLSQRYHNWIDRVIQSANSASKNAYRDIAANGGKIPDLKPSADGLSFVIEPITWRRGGIRGDDSDFNTNVSFSTSDVASTVARPVQLRKILASATLTRDPQKLAALHLVNPKHFDAHQLLINQAVGSSTNQKKYSMPQGLEECTVECTAEQKPLVLLALLLERLELFKRNQVKDSGSSNNSKTKNIVVIFTASVDSTHRLARLLQLLWMGNGYGDSNAVCEFSSSLSQKERSAILNRCNSTGLADDENNLSVVVCSDGASRGLDLQYASTVINYDVPGFAKTYVHRCGRTARAGHEGTAITLLKGSGQAGQFTKMRRLIQSPASVLSIGIRKDLVRGVVPIYRQCVQALRGVLEAEDNGDLNHRDVDLEEFLTQTDAGGSNERVTS